MCHVSRVENIHKFIIGVNDIHIKKVKDIHKFIIGVNDIHVKRVNRVYGYHCLSHLAFNFLLETVTMDVLLKTDNICTDLLLLTLMQLSTANCMRLSNNSFF